MTSVPNSETTEPSAGSSMLAILLAMAMFVLVVDTTIMNVSITAVARDLDATVSDIQSAIALEALVSAAFILIGSKVGDLIGRKLAYVLGLLAYAIGALGMTVAQNMAMGTSCFRVNEFSSSAIRNTSTESAPIPRLAYIGSRMRVRR